MTSKFALITPSFYGDYERCKLLVESVAKCIVQTAPYYVIVPGRDKNLFESLKNIYPVTIIEEESLLPWYVFNTPFSKKWRLNLFGLPLRGWMLQQICKLNVAKIAKEEVLVILDSDVCFIKKLDLNQFIKNNNARLLSVENRGNLPEHYPWHRVAARLLNLPATDYFGNGYIGNVITWRRDTLIKLTEHLRANNRYWLLKIMNQITFSEYILYGVFAEFVLKENSGHYKEETKGVKEYWTSETLSDKELSEFFTAISEEFAVMITAKSNIPLSRIRPHIEELWNKV